MQLPFSRRRFLQACLTGLVGWRLFPPQESFAQNPRVEAFLAQMTLREKVGQIFLLSGVGDTYTPTMHRLIVDYHAGGIVLFGYNISTPEALTALTNDLQRNALSSKLPIPLLIGADQEGGTILRLRGSGFSPFPSAMALGATQNPALTAQVAAAIATEMLACGLNLNLAPVLDVNTQPDNPVINIRAFGDDPQAVALHGQAFIEGTQKAGMVATGKHFPGHGSTTADSHYSLPVVNLDETQLRAELVPFKAAIAAQVGVMMTAHVRYSAWGDTPATFSTPILTDLLRTELGFDGVVMSDALTMGAVAEARDNKIYILRDALLAGVDMLAYGALTGQDSILLAEQIDLMETVIMLVESGLVPQSRLDDAARKVLTLKDRFGLLDWQSLNVEQTAERLHLSEHETLLQTVAQQTVTLWKDDNQLLPLSVQTPLALIYPFDYSEAAVILQATLPNALPLGYNLALSPTESRQIAAQIGTRTVLCLTADTARYPQQVDLINQLPLERTAVIALQSPYDWQKFPLVKTYLMTYGYTPHSIQALAEILLGQRVAVGMAPIRL